MVSSHKSHVDVCSSNTANTASLIWHALHALPSPSNQVNWAGFYITNKKSPNQLILGPFQGKVACQTIAFGRGVCGAAASSKRTQLVPDVEKFPGHIACDDASRSEIVVPIVSGGKVRIVMQWAKEAPADARQEVAIIDIDCAVENGFDEIDQKYLESLAGILADACDWCKCSSC